MTDDKLTGQVESTALDGQELQVRGTEGSEKLDVPVVTPVVVHHCCSEAIHSDCVDQETLSRVDGTQTSHKAQLYTGS